MFIADVAIKIIDIRRMVQEWILKFSAARGRLS